MKKRYQWSLVVAVIGGVLATKTATIRIIPIVEGCLMGGAIGFLIGWPFDRRNRASRSNPE